MLDNREQPDVSVQIERSSIHLLGVRIHTVSLDELMTVIELVIARGGRSIISNVNVYAMNLAYEQPWFRRFLNESTLVFCDGFGVKWAVRLLGGRIPDRITYADWMWDLAEFAQQHDFSLFFVGSAPGVANKAAIRLRERFPHLQIVGTCHGFFDKTPGSVGNEAVLRAISAVRPHILVVGFGMPLQEHWLMENWELLDVNIALPGGAVFDYVSNTVRRGPRWMTDHGLEWLSRLVIEPRRLWRRYLIGNPLFVWRVLKQVLGLLHMPTSLDGKGNP